MCSHGSVGERYEDEHTRKATECKDNLCSSAEPTLGPAWYSSLWEGSKKLLSGKVMLAGWLWQNGAFRLSWSRACTQGKCMWLEYEYAFGFSAYTDWHHHLWSTECLSLHHTILLLTKWHILYEGNMSMSWYSKCKAYSLIE